MLQGNYPTFSLLPAIIWKLCMGTVRDNTQFESTTTVSVSYEPQMVRKILKSLIITREKNNGQE